jgi:hypothetical protein
MAHRAFADVALGFAAHSRPARLRCVTSPGKPDGFDLQVGQLSERTDPFASLLVESKRYGILRRAVGSGETHGRLACLGCVSAAQAPLLQTS